MLGVQISTALIAMTVAMARLRKIPRHPRYGKTIRAGDDVRRAPEVPNINMADASWGCLSRAYQERNPERADIRHADTPMPISVRPTNNVKNPVE